MKSLVKILPLLLLLGTTAVVVGGCGDNHHYYDGYDYTITVVNDTPWDIFVEPWGFLLAPGDRVDVDIGPDIVHVIAVRHFDGLVLADVDMAYGDVLVVE